MRELSVAMDSTCNWRGKKGWRYSENKSSYHILLYCIYLFVWTLATCELSRNVFLLKRQQFATMYLFYFLQRSITDIIQLLVCLSFTHNSSTSLALLFVLCLSFYLMKEINPNIHSIFIMFCKLYHPIRQFAVQLSSLMPAINCI